MSNTASISEANVLSGFMKAEHTGQHVIDIDFAAGVTGTVNVHSRPIAGTAKPMRDANGAGNVIAITASTFLTVPGNREYAIIATAKGGAAGAITATLTEVEAP